jgi:geranylgeranyl diphosphate synthase, type II
MRSYKELYEIVEQGIAGLSFTQQPAELYQPVQYMLSLGGKRLRPVLVLMANELFGGDVKSAVKAALAVEMFHNFTLVHDDIMDQADIRRGQPTVHKKWNQTVAILSGDLMMVKATDLLCETEKGNLRELIAVFNKTAAEVCEGQQWDMNFESENNVTEYEYLNMITLKTAVLLGGSLKLGALIAGAGRQDAEHIYEFGKNIGIAFQIQDDILDSFGDGGKVGKKIGGDIVANKKTLLLIEALNNSNSEIREELQHWLEQENDAADSKIKAVLNIYEKCGVRAKAETLKDHYLLTAFKHLSGLSLSDDKTAILRQTAVDLMERIS